MQTILFWKVVNKLNIYGTKNITDNLNNLTYTDYYYRLMLLARCVFKWENLPNYINEKWIEKFLFYHGKCVFFNDSKLGLMVAQSSNDGDINMYEEPTKSTPYGVGYHCNKSLKVNSECVIIRNNDEMIPTKFFIELFAYRLMEITRTIDININAQKTPVLLTGPDKIKFSLKQVFNKITGNAPAIYGNNLLENFDIKAIKTDAPIVFPQLQTQKQTLWNEALTFLGVNNANAEKRERLITNEVDANNEHIELSAECFLRERQFACEQINRIFNTNISVRMRTEGEINECLENTPNT